MKARTLHTILDGFQKPELQDFANLLGQDLNPRLRKAQLVQQVDSYLRDEPFRWMSYLAERDALLLRDLVHAGPEKVQYQDFADYPSLLEVTGLVQFDDSDENYHKVWISREMYDIVSHDIEKVIRKGEKSGLYEMERVGMGYLNLYGIVPTDIFVDLMMDWYAEHYPDGGYDDLMLMLHQTPLVKLNRFNDEHGDYLCTPCLEDADEFFRYRGGSGAPFNYRLFSSQEAREAGSGAPYFTVGMKTSAGIALEEMFRRVGYSGFELVKAEHDTWIEAQYAEEPVVPDGIFSALMNSPRSSELDSQSFMACCEIIIKYVNSVPRWALAGASAQNTPLAVDWNTLREEIEKAAPEKESVPMDADYPKWTMPEPTVSAGYGMDSDFLPQGFAIPHVAPDDPCPCGSGLRYCRCHGKYLS